MPSDAQDTLYRVFIIGRLGHGPQALDFYHWLAVSVGQDAPPPIDELQIPVMPTPDAPVLAEWIQAIHQMVGTDPAERARTILVGHSTGAMACVRYAAALPPGNPIGGLLAVGAWWDLDGEWPQLRAFIDAPLDLAAARANLPRVITLISDNDPVTADSEGNAALWRERLDAEVRVIPGAEHFNHPVQPAVLQAFKDLLGM